jgi:hypothetical protein
MNAGDRLRLFQEYRGKAEAAAAHVEQVRRNIDKHIANNYPGSSALMHWLAVSDRALADAIGERNSYVQLSIMYSNLALLHRNEAS